MLEEQGSRFPSYSETRCRGYFLPQPPAFRLKLSPTLLPLLTSSPDGACKVSRTTAVTDSSPYLQPPYCRYTAILAFLLTAR
jgi:hypothetical protein